MSFSNWLSYLAPYRRLIAVILLLALLWPVTRYIAIPCCVEITGGTANQEQEAAERAYYRSNCSEADPWPIFIDKDFVPPKDAEHPKNPSKKIDTECEDLRAQWAMAVSARRLVDLTCYQLWLAVLGTTMLGGTLFYTARATEAASESASVAKSALVDLERPLVFVDVPHRGVGLDSIGRFTTVDRFGYRFRNFGRSPALLVDIVLRYPIAPKAQLPPPIAAATLPDRTLPTGIVVSNDVPYGENENLRAHYGYGGLFDGNRTPHTHELFFIGRFRYRDIFGTTYTVGFCFVYDPVHKRWVQTGDNEQYNYVRQEAAPERSTRTTRA